jgi:hypothetical protein
LLKVTNKVQVRKEIHQTRSIMIQVEITSEIVKECVSKRSCRTYTPMYVDVYGSGYGFIKSEQLMIKSKSDFVNFSEKLRNHVSNRVQVVLQCFVDSQKK